MAEKTRKKIELWFFRDMSSDQRLALFRLFGMPVDEIGETHGHQRIALKHVLRSLASPLPAEAAPKGVSVGVREALIVTDAMVQAFKAKFREFTEIDFRDTSIRAALEAALTQEATPADMADLIARPKRVQAAFEVWRSHPETGPNASALFEHIEALEASLASLSARLVTAEAQVVAAHLCGQPEFGNYDGQVVLVAPDWLKHKWPNGIGIDVCLALEIQKLWQAGIHTSGHCCGHGRAPAYISVLPPFVERMKSMGYEPMPHPDGRTDHFAPLGVGDGSSLSATPAAGGMADLIAVEPVAWLWYDAEGLEHFALGKTSPIGGDNPAVALYTADSLASLSARLVEVERERDAARTVHRWSVDDSGNGVLHVCRNQHAKEDKCEWEAFVPLTRAEAAEAKLAEADTVLARHFPFTYDPATGFFHADADAPGIAYAPIHASIREAQ